MSRNSNSLVILITLMNHKIFKTSYFGGDMNYGLETIQDNGLLYVVWIDEKAIVLETLLSFKRAGANLILTYHACDAAEWLRQELS